MSIWLQDRDRWFLWSPVLFGIGIHIYFSGWIMDLSYIYGISAVGLASIIALRKTFWAYAGIGVVCVALGMFFSAYKTESIVSNYHRLDSEWGGANKSYRQ
jgi:uncharacterized membrane protein